MKLTFRPATWRGLQWCGPTIYVIVESDSGQVFAFGLTPKKATGRRWHDGHV
jgi:hypothetical protein